MQQQATKRFGDEKAASVILDVPLPTLRDWRFRKVGPAFHRFGRSVRYNLDTLEEYARQCEVKTAKP
jgi:hypothetical protein